MSFYHPKTSDWNDQTEDNYKKLIEKGYCETVQDVCTLINGDQFFERNKIGLQATGVTEFSDTLVVYKHDRNYNKEIVFWGKFGQIASGEKIAVGLVRYFFETDNDDDIKFLRSLDK